ncbi:MAG: hypothetical protein HZB30_09110 [Nitrospirae bacterium]|nr:hypothetical protein [Nitrospirota bacterium]
MKQLFKLFFVQISIMGIIWLILLNWSATTAWGAPVLVETFDGTALDSLRWSGNAQVQDGQLVWDIPANGQGSGGISSVFTLSGDIDVRIDFNFTLWPANSGIHLAGLELSNGPYWLTAERFWDWGRQSDVGVIHGIEQYGEVALLTRQANTVSLGLAISVRLTLGT